MQRRVLAALADGESFTVEFKRHRTKADLSEQELVETVICLANGSGGLLLLGVEDDGSVSGFEPPADPHLIAALVLNRTQPGVPVSVTAHEIAGKTVMAIDVPDMQRVVGTKSGLFKRRAIRLDGTPECVPYTAEEMLSAALFAGRQDYAALPARGAEPSDLDPKEFDRFRSLCALERGDSTLAEMSDTEICRALRLLDPIHPTQLTIGAILLFGTESALQRFVPTAEMQFQVRGNRDELRRNETLRAPLFRTMRWVTELMDSFNDEEEVLLGLTRVALPRLAPPVAREAVANALVHRDYTQMGSIRVQLGPSALSITSPGGFLPGVTLDNLLEASVQRSPILAEAFQRAGLVDRAGRGISLMFRAQLLAGRDEPDYSRSTSANVRLDVPTTDADLDMVRFVTAYENGAARSLPLPQVRILHELHHVGRSTPGELAESLRLSPLEVRSACTRLVETGLIEQVGSGRARQYTLGPAFYAAAQDRNAYVRVRAADPVQQRQMVVQYVTAYGSITRGQVMSLCSVGVAPARSLLRSLVDDGTLTMRGERRGAHYVLSQE